MLVKILMSALAALAVVEACPEHDFHASRHVKRAEPVATKWAYEASYNWGQLSEDYYLCQAGTQQAPIPLLLTQGLSQNHIPTFNYNATANGTFFNWGYGPAMSLAHEQGVYTTLPSFTFEDNGANETVYMTGWHIHAPADHSVGGDRSKAEMHFVHTDASGKPRAVLAFRIDPGNSDSPFFSALPEYHSFREVEKNTTTNMSPSVVMDEVNWFSEFWTYKGEPTAHLVTPRSIADPVGLVLNNFTGSLTSPPCTEGIRFFVARNILFVGNQQMQDILRVSTYSARAEQEVWLHQINV
jgi:carbonic anhydrase